MYSLPARFCLFVALLFQLGPSAALASDYPDTVAAASSDKQAQIDQALDRSGLRTRIARIPEQLSRYFKDYPGAKPASDETLTSLAQNSFSTQLLEQHVEAALVTAYDAQHMHGYLAVTADPLWSQMRALNVQEPSSSELKAFIRDVTSRPLPKERLKLLQRVDNASGATRTTVDSLQAMMRAVGHGMAQTVEKLPNASEQPVPAITTEQTQGIQTTVLLAMLYAYRNVPDADVMRYAAMLESPDVQWFNQIVYAAYLEGSEEAMNRFVQAVIAETSPAIPDGGQCAADKATAAERIADCTHVLESGKLTVEQRARAYTNRGEAYDQQGDFDKAMADLDQSIRLYPKDTDAYHDRGNAHNDRGEYDAAIADFDQALRLDPKSAWSFKDRGAAWGYKGDYGRALADVNEAIRLNSRFGEAYYSRGQLEFYEGQFDRAASDLDAVLTLAGDDNWLKDNLTYVVLWAYLSRSHSGAEGKVKLAAQIQGLSLDKWPGPVINFYLGKLDAQAVLAETAKADADDQVQQKCEANFYIGEDYLLRKDIAQARRFLGTARDICPPVFIEFHGAEAEMKRLQ